jgi:3-deoxy-D-manno-octulosonic-acid transferase
MNFLYNLAMCGMSLVFSLAAPFNRKARLWRQGRRRIFQRLREAIDPEADIAWFHAASLGEFEQGRPVIEAFRKKYPSYQILLTFFSPSGYEIRKNYAGADYIFYLPVDTSWNARRFVRIVRPKIAIFIKYEFWRNYLRTLHRGGTRIFCISALFRPDSAFFNPVYGGWYRKLLGYFEHIFVQNDDSRDRLAQVGATHVTVAGDTRFDRVWAIARQARELPPLESFASDGRPVFIAGSTWPPDEELLVRLIDASPEAKFIIAPHEIHEERIQKLIESISRPAFRYTRLTPDTDLSRVDVLILDTIGILSSAYRYGCYGYIGGGFGVGIHNTLEAAVFGLPLAFGPNYTKFQEARDLIDLGGARSISDYRELGGWYTGLREDAAARKKASDACRTYVEQGRGATEIILSRL